MYEHWHQRCIIVNGLKKTVPPVEKELQETINDS